MSVYVKPSACDRCVPVESYGDNTTNYSHEAECPNARKGQSK